MLLNILGKVKEGQRRDAVLVVELKWVGKEKEGEEKRCCVSDVLSVVALLRDDHYV